MRENIGEIVDNGPKAPAAAAWLRKMLGETGKATAVAVREILVNVTSEVVKRALMGH